MVVPDVDRGRRKYWEVLKNARQLVRRIHGREVRFFVEPARPGWTHPCTVDDLVRVLGAIPADDLGDIGAIVLRQPTRKQAILRPVWGRLAHFAEIGAYSGPAIILDSQEDVAIRWGRSLDPDDAAELGRLRSDGHAIEETKRGFVVRPTLDSCRATVLYRTLLHEIGHRVDRRDYSERGQDDAYDQRPAREREAFAHRYAERVATGLRARRVIPFARIIDRLSVTRDNLDPNWFGSTAAHEHSAPHAPSSTFPAARVMAVGGAFSESFGPAAQAVVRVNRDMPLSLRVRLVGADGADRGTMAVRQALAFALSEGLDLVEVGPSASPPVCKLVDWDRYKLESISSARRRRERE